MRQTLKFQLVVEGGREMYLSVLGVGYVNQAEL